MGLCTMPASSKRKPISTINAERMDSRVQRLLKENNQLRRELGHLRRENAKVEQSERETRREAQAEMRRAAEIMSKLERLLGIVTVKVEEEYREMISAPFPLEK